MTDDIVVTSDTLLGSPLLGRSAHAYGEPMKAFAPEQRCTLVEYHAPLPVMIESHHRLPQYLQIRLYGKVIHQSDTDMLWVCGNCHDAIHAWLYYLLGEHRQPPYCGRAAKTEALRSFNWFNAEQARLTEEKS